MGYCMGNHREHECKIIALRCIPGQNRGKDGRRWWSTEGVVWQSSPGCVGSPDNVLVLHRSEQCLVNSQNNTC